jgi:hypothetical protein
VRDLKSKPLDPERSEAVRRRIEAALAKHDRGEKLTEQEELLVYWVRHGGGCHACGGPSPGVMVVVRSPDLPDAR